MFESSLCCSRARSLPNQRSHRPQKAMVKQGIVHTSGCNNLGGDVHARYRQGVGMRRWDTMSAVVGIGKIDYKYVSDGW